MTRIALGAAILLVAACVTVNGDSYRATPMNSTTPTDAFANGIRNFAATSGFQSDGKHEPWGEQFLLARQVPDHWLFWNTGTVTQWLGLTISKAGITNCVVLYQAHTLRETPFKREFRLQLEDTLLSLSESYRIEKNPNGVVSSGTRIEQQKKAYPADAINAK